MDSKLKTRISKLLRMYEWGHSGLFCFGCGGGCPPLAQLKKRAWIARQDGHTDNCELGKILKELELETAMDSRLKNRIRESLKKFQWGTYNEECLECGAARPSLALWLARPWLPLWLAGPGCEPHADYCELNRILKELEANNG